MRLAICDDQAETLPGLKERVESLELVDWVETFSDLDRFLKTMDERNDFDVVLLDIEWGERESGIDFAEELYEKYPDLNVIYFTGYAEKFMSKIFFKNSRLCGYLQKPLKLAELEILLEKIEEYRNSKKEQDTLIIKYNQRVQQIPKQNIIYLESRGHVVTIYTKEGEYVCREKLEDILERLGTSFVHPHKSFGVNADCIKNFTCKQILLDTGKTLAVSRSKYKELKEQFFRYKGEKLTREMDFLDAGSETEW